MPLLRPKLSDLQTLSAPSAESLGTDGAPGDAAGLEARIRRQFRLLPDPITVKCDEVVVEFSSEGKAGAILWTERRNCFWRLRRANFASN